MEEFFNKIKESFTDATLEFETITIKVDSTEWIKTHHNLKDEFNLKFFSWLSAMIGTMKFLLEKHLRRAFHLVSK